MSEPADRPDAAEPEAPSAPRPDEVSTDPAAAGRPAEPAEPDEEGDRPPTPHEPPPESPLDQARAETARMREQLLRTAADFDNFRKRSRREVDEAAKRAREETLREILPVFDNLERAVAHADQAPDAKAVSDGVRMVLKQFADALGRIGVQRIATVGAAFDPTVHEAIQQVETADQPAGTVVAEVQAGWAAGERLVRAALVVVAKAPAASGDDGPATDPN